METSDIIAVVAAVTAFGSVCISAWALKYARKQAEIADKALTESSRSATAGEKSADAADIAAQEAKRSADAAEESNRIAARTLELSEPPAVDWETEPVAGSTYQLRNQGTSTAEKFEIDGSRIACSHRRLPDDATVLPNASVEFQLWQGGGRPGPVPSELFVKWDGQSHPTSTPPADGPCGTGPALAAVVAAVPISLGGPLAGYG
ncbi:hypothetical protein [Nocardia grenadensis]|uniref:hypothetical protein n=1 Tax=Nocardia grenadensis TaxID=931537 RepID=UPI003D8FCDFE